MLKTIFKLLVSLVTGMAAGLLIAVIIVICFTDTTFAEFLDKLKSTDLSEGLIAAGAGIIAFYVSITLLVTVHETGHLVCGLLSGYKFISFRIFSLTFIRIDGKLRLRHYSIAGTGGQCLLTPPDVPTEQIPTAWYNFGGVLFNLMALLAAIPLFFIEGHPFLSEFLVIFAVTDVVLIALNGIPMKISGAGNDAYNMLLLRKEPESKRSLVLALRSNALIQEGIRPKDMPGQWFVVPEKINYRNQLEVSVPMMAASRLVDELRYEEALDAFERLYAHENELIALYVKEIKCELVFLRLVCGDTEGASQLLDDNLKRYINAYRKVMSSKERILCAIALKLDNSGDRAVAIYEDVVIREQDYLLQGEVRSDLAVMRDILTRSGLLSDSQPLACDIR